MQPEEQTPWQYKPETTPEADSPPPAAPVPNEDPQAQPAPADLAPSVQPGKSSFSWTAVEFIEHERGTGWYMTLVGATALLAGLMFLIKDIFATGVMVVLGIILAIMAGRKPRQMQYELSGDGLRVGEKLYPYGDCRSFAILTEEGNVKSITMLPLKRIALPVSAYFDPKDEQHIIDAISDYLPYEEHQSSVVDRLGHRLRI